MSMSDLNSQFDFSLSGETLGRLFMPRASTFEVLTASVVQESFVIDSVRVESPSGRCRLTFSEWEEDAKEGGKLWVSEFGIELAVEEHIAYGTYSTSFSPEQRDAGVLLERLRRDAEEDFMLCAKLIGRSVRRDLVIDEDMPERPKPGSNLH
jgi:hypothetical protein